MIVVPLGIMVVSGPQSRGSSSQDGMLAAAIVLTCSLDPHRAD